MVNRTCVRLLDDYSVFRANVAAGVAAGAESTVYCVLLEGRGGDGFHRAHLSARRTTIALVRHHVFDDGLAATGGSVAGNMCLVLFAEVA
jgi:hypothetical protein